MTTNGTPRGYRLREGWRTVSVIIDEIPTLADLVEYLARMDVDLKQVMVHGLYGEPTVAEWQESCD